MLSNLINKDKVVKRLIRIRCKYADQRSDQLQLHDFVEAKDRKGGGFRTSEEQSLIYSLFPPRKKWCHMGPDKRAGLDSTKRNEERLWHTYLKAKNCDTSAQWYARLCEYADYIIHMIFTSGWHIPHPRVFVIEKERTDNEIICRPVCTFPLHIKLALSMVNKALTTLFDGKFLPYSFAFRSVKSPGNNFQHLDAVRKLRDYRIKHLGQKLYVAECDMQKFYDTIDHRIIKQRFNILLSACKRERRISHDEYKVLHRWFYAYVDCFSFPTDVYRLNRQQDSRIWNGISQRNGKKCKIAWVDALVKRNFSKKSPGLGVPQGGALSGLIANIVMHFVDVAVEASASTKDICYLRFCDDMILVGTDKSAVNHTFATYRNCVSASCLYPHAPKEMAIEKMRNFWKGKTRGPYAWDAPGTEAYPWVTFVGYDCNWKGELRIRRKSVRKQIAKQYSTVHDLLNHYRRGARPRYTIPTILASLQSRLIGMSVGRVALWNYEDNENIHSWMSAFPILDKNKWTERQMKQLDRHRCQVLSRARRFLWSMDVRSDRKMEHDDKRYRSRKYVGKAFSYYGQCFDYKHGCPV